MESKVHARISPSSPPPESYHVPPFESEADPFIISSSPSRRMVWNAIVADFAGVLFGYHVGVVNIPLEHIVQDLGIAGNATAQGWVVSILLLGAAFGCACSGSMSDKYGRRSSLQLATAPMIFGALFSAVAHEPVTMYLGRFLVGLGLGVAGPVMSTYVSEFANCLGLLTAYAISIPASNSSQTWRICFALSLIPAVVLLVGMQCCEESPRWLLKHRGSNEAERAYQRLGVLYTKGDERQEENTEVSLKVLLSRRYLPVIARGMGLFTLQQLSGINAVFIFSTTVFQNAGVHSDVVASVLVGVFNLIASGIAVWLIHRQGRRDLLMFSFAGMALFMGVLSTASNVSILQPYQAYVSVVGTLLYVVMFALGAGPVPSLLLPEMFPDRIRGQAISVCMVCHWIFNFLVNQSFLLALHTVGISSVFAVFTAVSAAAVGYVAVCISETKGKSMDELEARFLPD